MSVRKRGGGGPAPRVVAGGYLALTVPQLLLPWFLYSKGALQLLHVRVWFALAEMRERRKFTGEDRQADYGIAELLRLLGGNGVSRARAAVKRLHALGLVTWSKDSLELAVSPDQVRSDLGGFWELLSSIENNRRKVPVPRRIARFLAGGASRAEAATVVGHLLRCCYLRGGEVAPVGNCTAAFVEEVFGVHATRVKQARARLVRLGLLIAHDQPQWHRNRYGSRIEVNLSWSREASVATPVGEGGVPGTSVGTEARPPAVGFHNSSATPKEENRSLPPEGTKNQNPGGETPESPTGSSKKSKEKPEASTEAKAPSLVHVELDDLKNTERLLKLHRQATVQHLVPAGERGELEFVALAEHARAYATSNAAGMFAWLVRNYERAAKRFVTQDDEESARLRLREHRQPSERPAVETRSVRVDATERGPQAVGHLLDSMLAALGQRTTSRVGLAESKKEHAR